MLSLLSMLMYILVLDLMQVRLDWILLVCENPCCSAWSTSLPVLQRGGAIDLLATASYSSRLVVGLANPWP
jgi:hypothetical protein